MKINFIRRFKLIKPSVLIFLLSVLTSVYLLVPLLKGGLAGVFFSIDPDAQYIGNSISYIKMRQIQYINHPGTPSILMYAYFLTPLRFYAKIIDHTNFIFWFINHVEFSYYYLRLIQSAVFCISLIIFLQAVYSFTGSKFSIFFSWLCLFTFSSFPYLTIYIRAETFSFLLLSMWLWIFSQYLKLDSPKKLVLLSAFGALLTANKFTNVFFFLGSIIFIFINKKVYFIQKVFLTIANLILALLVFLVSTWPIRHKYTQLFAWVYALFGNSGLYGSGKHVIFDLDSYIISVEKFIRNEFGAVMIVAIIFFIIIRLLLKKIYIKPDLLILSLVLFTGSIIFAKYPLNYYQLTHYIGFIFIIALMVGNISVLKKILFMIFLVIFAIQNISGYINNTSEAILESSKLNMFVKSNPAKIGSVWEWGRNREFVLLWGNTWSGGSYSDEMSKLGLNLYQLDIYDDEKENKSIFDICWDHLYIQKVSVAKFLEKYAFRKLELIEIPDIKNMILLKSDHCLKKT